MINKLAIFIIETSKPVLKHSLLHSILIMLLLSTLSGLQAHPWGGLVLDQKGDVFFSGIDPVVGNGHYAAIFQVRGEDSIRCVLKSKHSPSDMILARTPVLSGLCVAERFSYAPNHQSQLWEYGAAKWRPRFAQTNSNGFHVQAFLIGDSSEVIYFAKGQQLFVLEKEGEAKPFLPNATFNRIEDLAWGPNGQIYVLQKSNISIISKDKEVKQLDTELREADPDLLPFCGANIIFDVVVDGDGNAYLAYFGNRQVLKVTPDGERTVFYQTKAPWTPHGLDLYNGELYVLESTVGDGVPNIVQKVVKVDELGTAELIYAHSSAIDAEKAYADNVQQGRYVWMFCGVVILGILIAVKFGK